jgi:hypothetical protein
MKNKQGALVGERFDPFQRVGIYVPGGTAPLVSTAVMTCTLAAVAGVPEIVAVTPAAKDGSVHPALLGALAECGATEVYRAGGAQAIGALAHGTKTIRPVQKIFGPGNAYVVEAKRRLWAFDLSGRSRIQIKGLNIFGASIKTGSPTVGSASDITLNELDVQYPWYFVEYPRNSRKMSFNGAIRLYGSNNTLKNSLIRYAASDVLRVEGSNNHVENNVFYDIGFMGASMAINGQNGDAATATQYFEQNTVFNSGAQALHMAPMWKIRYNDAYNSHGLVTDTGTFYSWGTNGKGAEIAYNYVHDNWAIRGRSFPQFFGGSNIYFDFATSNYLAHHNVTWGATKAGILLFSYDHNATAMIANPDPNAQAISLINNTVDADFFVDTKAGVHMTNTRVINNLVTRFTNAVTAANGVSYLSNATIANSSVFVDRANRDYRLNGSPSGVSDAGTVTTPYTDGYTGSAPDIGAFEGSSQTWVAGAV